MTARWFALRLAALVVLVGVGVAVAVTVGVPSPTQLQARFAALGPWSGVVFAAVYAAVSLSPLPKTVFTIAAGALFGVPLGLLVVITGATVGALAALYLGRWLGRDAVHRFTGIRTGRFDEQLERRGLWAVLVARLIPVVPFTGVQLPRRPHRPASARLRARDGGRHGPRDHGLPRRRRLRLPARILAVPDRGRRPAAAERGRPRRGRCPTTSRTTSRCRHPGCGQRLSHRRRAATATATTRRMPGWWSWSWTWAMLAFHTPSP